MRRILTLTMNPAIDVGSCVDEVVAEKKLRCEAPTIEAGGGGINVSRALHRLGVESTAVFPSGGLFSDCQQRLLEAEGVQYMTYTTENGIRRINYHVREQSENRQYRFCLPGAKMRECEWKRVLEIVGELIDEDAILVVSGSRPPGVPPEFHAQIAAKVNKAAGVLILDEPGDFLRSLADSHVDWITPNRQEFEQMIGRSVEHCHLTGELEAFVRESPVRNVLLTMGSEGVLYAGAEGSLFVAAPKVDVVSTVGAGDSTVAGLSYALAEGRPHREALQWAVAAGAASVMTPASNLLEQRGFAKLRDAIASDA